MDAHRPFEPREAYDRWGDERARELQRSLDPRWEWAFHGGDRPYWQLSGLESLYDGGIRQADAVVEAVVERLRQRGVLDETLVVVCGDHGDGFGEPGYVAGEPPAVSHIVPMHEALLHVPLLVRPPGGGAGERCHRPAALTQFPAVVQAHVDGDQPERGFATERVVSMKQPVTADLRDRFDRACEDLDSYTAASRAVYMDAPGTAVRKRYYWGETGLEALVHGPGDFQPQGSVEPATVDAAFEGGERVEDGETGIREPLGGRQVTDEAREQLAALGYY
jgi:arylsulfatase A